MGRKKILTISGIILGVLLLIALPLYPYFFGVMAESSIKDIVGEITEKGKGTLDVAFDYKRSYGKSKALIELRQIEGNDNLTPTIKLSFDLNHFKMSAFGVVDLNPDFEATYLTNFQEIPKITFDAGVSLLGNLKVKFDLEKMSFTIGEKEKAYSFALSPAELRFNLSGSSINYSKIMVPEITLKEAKSKSHGKDIVIEWEKDKGIKTMDSSLKVKLKEYIGPDYNLKNGDLHFSLMNLDNKVLDKIGSTLMNLKDIVESDNKTGILMELVGLLPRLVERNPRVELKVSNLETNNGNIDLDAFLAIASNGPVGILNFLQSLQSKIVFNGPQAAVEKALEEYLYWGLVREATSKLQQEHQEKLVKQVNNAKGNKSSGTKALNQAPPQLSDGELQKLRSKAKESIQEKIHEFFEKKYIVKRDNGVFSEFTLDKGEMKVNGNPFYLTGGNG